MKTKRSLLRAKTKQMTVRDEVGMVLEPKGVHTISELARSQVSDPRQADILL